MRGQWVKYSEEELEFLSENRTLTISEYHAAFVQRFGRADVTPANLHALRKRKKWRTGRTGHYQPGEQPWNKGLTGYMPANKTSFKKGNRPHNWKPIGHERITADGYLERKVSDTGCTRKDYVAVHRLIWEEHNGPIPGGHVVIFKDRNQDKQQVTLEQLMLVSRKELLHVNKYLSGMAGNETAHLIAKVEMKANQLKSGVKKQS